MISLKAIHSEIRSVKSKLLIQENTSVAILDRLESLSSDIKLLKKENNELKSEIDFLQSKTCNHTVNPHILSSDQLNLDIVHELKEREQKFRNIIIFNVNEWDDDKPLFKNLLSTLNLNYTY